MPYENMRMMRVRKISTKSLHLRRYSKAISKTIICMQGQTGSQVSLNFKQERQHQPARLQQFMQNPQILNKQAGIIDQCLAPVIAKFYLKQYDSANFDEFRQQILQPNTLPQHEALIAIEQLVSRNDLMVIQKVVSSGLLLKIVLFLKDEQFPELCLIALRTLMKMVNRGRVAQIMIKYGIIPALIGLIDWNKHRLLTLNAAWLLRKVASLMMQKNYLQNQQRMVQLTKICFIESQSQEVAEEICGALIQAVNYNAFILKPQDNQRFFQIFLTQLQTGSIQQPTIMTHCLTFVQSNSHLLDQTIQEQGFLFIEKLIRVIASQQGLTDPDVLETYVLFLAGLGNRLSFHKVKCILIQADILEPLMPLLQNQSPSTRTRMCEFLQVMLRMGGQDIVSYFLSKGQIMLKLHNILQNDLLEIRGKVCTIFAALTRGGIGQVLRFFQDVKIVGYYARLFKQYPKELARSTLVSLVEVMAFCRLIDEQLHTTFLEQLKEDRIEEELIKYRAQNITSEEIDVLQARQAAYYLLKIIKS